MTTRNRGIETEPDITDLYEISDVPITLVPITLFVPITLLRLAGLRGRPSAQHIGGGKMGEKRGRSF